LKVKWGYEKTNYFVKPILKADRIIEDWFWWIVLFVSIGVAIWAGLKLYQLYLIKLWLETL